MLLLPLKQRDHATWSLKIPTAVCPAVGAFQQAWQCLGNGFWKGIICHICSVRVMSLVILTPTRAPQCSRQVSHPRLAVLTSSKCSLLFPGCKCLLGVHQKREQTSSDLSSSSCLIHLTWQGEKKPSRGAGQTDDATATGARAYLMASLWVHQQVVLWNKSGSCR